MRSKLLSFWTQFRCKNQRSAKLFKSGKKQSYLLGFEQLEDRTLPSVTASFSPSSYTVGEGGGAVNVTVALSGSVSTTSTVNYSTGAAPSNSATAGSDYTATSGTLTFTSRG